MIIALAIVAFLLALVGTELIRRRALRAGVLDVPGARSSHTVATPRGGGIAIVAAFMLGMVALKLLDLMEARVFWALSVGGLAVAAIGYADDRFTLSPKVRIVVHFCAALWALYVLGGLPPLRLGEHVYEFALGGYVLGTVAIVWVLNLFNFMDGIDGIAASEAIFIVGAAAVLAWFAGGSQANEVVALGLLLASACAGFLVWNWPPARIFMGDVASGFLGYAIAVLTVVDAGHNSVAPLLWLLLGAVFFVDATVTLVRRVARGERAQDAHRSHAYQRLSRLWQSHRKVTLTVLLVNVLWLLPCALAAAAYPEWAVYVLLMGLAPVLAAVMLAGAGSPE